MPKLKHEFESENKQLRMYVHDQAIAIEKFCDGSLQIESIELGELKNKHRKHLKAISKRFAGVLIVAITASLAAGIWIGLLF